MRFLFVGQLAIVAGRIDSKTDTVTFYMFECTCRRIRRRLRPRTLPTELSLGEQFDRTLLAGSGRGWWPIQK